MEFSSQKAAKHAVEVRALSLQAFVNYYIEIIKLRLNVRPYIVM